MGFRSFQNVELGYGMPWETKKPGVGRADYRVGGVYAEKLFSFSYNLIFVLFQVFFAVDSALTIWYDVLKKTGEYRYGGMSQMRKTFRR